MVQGHPSPCSDSCQAPCKASKTIVESEDLPSEKPYATVDSSPHKSVFVGISNGAGGALERSVVITGFNTDIEHQGVIYHVQTEDKGLASPLILSLVYTGGEILASKRSRYDDLVSAGFNEHTLAERLQRQHKLICAAIHAGRLEDLRRMGQSHAATPAAMEPAPPLNTASLPDALKRELANQETAPLVQSSHHEQTREPTTAAPLLPLAQTPSATTDEVKTRRLGTLSLGLLEEQELQSGEFATLRVRLSSGTGENQNAVPDTAIIVKILGTTFKQLVSSSRTDQDGIAIVFVAPPRFTTGRGAILIRAEIEGEIAELRRIILPAR